MTIDKAIGIASECVIRGIVTEEAHSYDFWEMVIDALEYKKKTEDDLK